MALWANKKVIRRTPRNIKVGKFDTNIESYIARYIENIGGGDPFAGVCVDPATLTGTGLPGSPLTVIAGDGGDNWGTQAVCTDATMCGDGTVGSLLGSLGLMPGQVDNVSELLNDAGYITVADVYRDNILLEGGISARAENQLIIDAFASKWVFDNVLYQQLLVQEITLDPEDPTNPRIDVIVLRNTGPGTFIITTLTGTPSADPAKPDIDENTDLELGFVLVNNVGELPQVTQQVIYDENAGGEWTQNVIPAGSDNASVTDPFNNAVSFYIPQGVSTDTLEFQTPSGVISVTDDLTLLFSLKVTTLPFANQDSIYISVGNSVTGQSSNERRIRNQNAADYGLDLTDTSRYYRAQINVGADLNQVPAEIDTVTFRFANNTPNTNLRLDYIVIQEGVATPPPQIDYVSNVTLQGTDLTFTGEGAAFSGQVDLSTLASSIPVSDEGSQLTAGVTSFNFVGGGVTATNVGDAVTVCVPTPPTGIFTDVDAIGATRRGPYGLGFENCVCAGSYSAILGGILNTISMGSGSASIIGGGTDNQITGGLGAGNSILGGSSNRMLNSCPLATVSNNVIGGGSTNLIGTSSPNTRTVSFSTIAGGGNNTICLINEASCNTISGGFCNTITNSVDSTISGGCCNRVETNFGGILGGQLNTISVAHTCSFIVGSNITSVATCTTHVNCLYINNGGFCMPTGATNGYVLTTDANGAGTWQSQSSANTLYSADDNIPDGRSATLAGGLSILDATNSGMIFNTNLAGVTKHSGFFTTSSTLATPPGAWGRSYFLSNDYVAQLLSRGGLASQVYGQLELKSNGVTGNSDTILDVRSFGTGGTSNLTIRNNSSNGGDAETLIESVGTGGSAGNMDIIASDALYLEGTTVDIRSTQGTPNSGVTAVTTGDGRNFTTVLTVNQTSAFNVGNGVSLATGSLLYTLPAGDILVHGIYMSMAINGVTEQATDTPDVGLGTTIGSGANATLDLVGAGAEDLLTGQTATDCSGTATVALANTASGIGDGLILAGDNHTLYFNVADAWAAGATDLSADISGTVTIEWTLMS